MASSSLRLCAEATARFAKADSSNILLARSAGQPPTSPGLRAQRHTKHAKLRYPCAAHPGPSVSLLHAAVSLKDTSRAAQQTSASAGCACVLLASLCKPDQRL